MSDTARLFVGQLSDDFTSGNNSIAAVRATLARGRGAGALLEAILSEPSSITRVARLSYWHSNGFAKLVLYENAAVGFRIRLHAWLDSILPVEDTNVHSHRWNFASIVLSGGGLETCDFRINDAGQRYHSFAYNRSRNGSSALEPLGFANLSEYSRQVLEVGSTYTCETHELHRTRALPGPQLFTLIVQGSTVRPYATVYSSTGAPHRVVEPNRKLSEEEVRVLIRRALDSIASSKIF